MSDLKIRLALDSGSFVTGMGTATGKLSEFERGGRQAADSSERLASAVARVGHYAVGLAGLAQVSQYARGAVALADEFANLSGRLALVSSSSQQAAATQKQLFDVAQQTRTKLGPTTELYDKLAMSTESLGISQSRLIGLTRTIGQTMALSGGGAQSMQAALMQLGQGLASGTLRGEELNSVIEQTPALAQALAEGMGKSVGELKAMGEAGKITAAQIVTALENRAAKVEADFSKLPLTVGQAVTQMGNSLLQSVGVFDQANGLSRGFAQGISALSQNMDVLATVAATLAGAVAGKLVAALGQSAAAMAAERAARVASTQAALAHATAEVASTAATRASAVATAQTAAIMSTAAAQKAAATAATVAHTAALSAQAVAQTAANRAASLAGLAVGALGGPVGLITTLLGAGVAAWAAWGNASGAAEAKASGAVAASTEDIIADLDKQIQKLRERNRLATASPSLAGDTPAADQLARSLARIEELKARTGEAAALNEGARQALLQKELKDYAALSVRVETLNVEQAKAKAIAQGPVRDTWMTKYATDAEKLQAELKKAREELGGALPRDLEARIREKFPDKDAKKSSDEAAQKRKQTAEEAARSLAAYRNLVADLAGEQSGLSANFNEQAAGLAKGWKLSGDSAAVYDKVYGALLAKQPFVVDRLKEEARMREEISRLEQRQASDQAASLEKLRDVVKDQNERNDAIGLEGLALADLEYRRALANVTLMEERMYIEEAGGASMDRLKYLVEEIRLQRELAEARRNGAVQQVSANEAKAALDDSKRFFDQMGQSLSDALMNGGKSAGDYIKGLFRNMALRPVIQSVMSPMVAGLGSMMGSSAYASGAGSAGGNALSSLSSLGSLSKLGGLGGLAGLGSAFSGGVGLAMSGAGGTGLALQGAGSMIGSGSIGAGFAQGAGALAPWAVGGMAGLALGKGISGGYSAFGGTGNAAVNVGTIAGAVLGGPIGAAIGGLIGGVANRAFGRKGAEAQAITGTLGDKSGLSTEMLAKGGWFRSDKRTTEALDKTSSDALQGGFDALKTQAADFAKALGGPADTIKGYTTAVSIALTKDAAANEKAITEFLTAQGEKLAGMAAQGLEAFARTGETMSQTAGRLAGSLTSVNDAFQALGRGLLPLSAASGELASKIADAFGGTQAFASSVGAYMAAIYTDAERLAAGQSSLASAFGKLGQAVPSTAADYRKLVEAQDLTSEGGRTLYAALVRLAPAFAEITTTAAEANKQAAQDAADLLANIADQRADLEGQLLEAQGNTAAIRARELAKLDASNQALQTRIWALEDEQAAMAALSSAGQSIVEFVNQLRGAGGGAQSPDSLRGTYLATLAGAKAGDIGSSGSIASAASSLVEQLKATATDPIALARETSRIASELQNLPAALAYEGSRAAAADATATGEAIAVAVTPVLAAASNSSAQSQAAMLTEMQAVRAEMAAMRATQESQGAAIVAGVTRTAAILSNVTPDGDSIAIRTAA